MRVKTKKSGLKYSRSKNMLRLALVICQTMKKSVGVFIGKAEVSELIFIPYDSSCFKPIMCV